MANAHTFFVGEAGVAVHNSECTIPRNSIDGRNRENRAQDVLERRYPDASVQREQYLRNADGSIARDSTGSARRLDHVVIEDGKVRGYFETTSQTADKTAQLAKQAEIINNGGTYIRDRTTGKLLDLSSPS